MLRIGMTNPPYILEHLEVNAVWLVSLGACSQHEGGQPTFSTHPFKQFFQVTGSVKSRLDRDSFKVNFYSELNTNYSYPAKAETQVCFLSSGNRTTTPCYSLYSWEKMHVPLFVSFFAVEKIILLLVTFISSCMCMHFFVIPYVQWLMTQFNKIFSPSSQEMAKILNHPRVYSFLHVPVQSASDNVLSDMKREYCADDFRHVVDFLREK